MSYPFSAPDIKSTEQHIHILEWKNKLGTLLLGSYCNSLCLCEWKTAGTSYPNLHKLRRSLDADIVVERNERCNHVIRQTLIRLQEYLDNKRPNFDIPIMLTGTAFQQQVQKEIITIPYGKTISYKELAQRINQPQAIRAVANAAGSNPLMLIIPCHRIIGSDGKLTGYAGGLDIKRRLLSIEQTHIRDTNSGE